MGIAKHLAKALIAFAQNPVFRDHNANRCKFKGQLGQVSCAEKLV